jgi:hypothetical protein
LRERKEFNEKIDQEIQLVEDDIKNETIKLTGISDNLHTWVVRDVFITRFWGEPEVCMISNISNGYVTFIRVESIREHKTLKKDFCGAQVEVELFLKINKDFIHHSRWYPE